MVGGFGIVVNIDIAMSDVVYIRTLTINDIQHTYINCTSLYFVAGGRGLVNNSEW